MTHMNRYCCSFNPEMYFYELLKVYTDPNMETLNDPKTAPNDADRDQIRTTPPPV